jgi:hypothetical protein
VRSTDAAIHDFIAAADRLAVALVGVFATDASHHH